MIVRSLAYKANTSTYVGLGLVNFAIALRFVARWVGRLRITIDDYLMLLALASYWGMSAGALVAISENGLGLPLADTSPKALSHFMKVLFAETFLYVTTVTFTKMSILTMYQRVLPSRWTRINVYLCGTLVLLWTTAIFITTCLACIPIQRIWKFDLEGTCVSWPAYYYGMQIPNITTDIYIVIIPLREVFALRLTRLQKIILVGIFGIALVTIIFDIVRLVAMLQFAASDDDITIGIINPIVCDHHRTRGWYICSLPLQPSSTFQICFEPRKKFSAIKTTPYLQLGIYNSVSKSRRRPKKRSCTLFEAGSDYYGVPSRYKLIRSTPNLLDSCSTTKWARV